MAKNKKLTKKEQLAILTKLRLSLPSTPIVTTALQALEEEIKKPPPVPPPGVASTK